MTAEGAGVPYPPPLPHRTQIVAGKAVRGGSKPNYYGPGKKQRDQQVEKEYVDFSGDQADPSALSGSLAARFIRCGAARFVLVV